MQEYTFLIDEENIGDRIDKYITASVKDITRSAVQNLINHSNVLVNDKKIDKNYKLRKGDIIMVNIPDPVELNVVAENIPLDIVYEDSDLLVVNKPKGMVVHPAAGNYTGTLVNALMYHCGNSLSGINGILRPGIVHRIDKDTSGLLIVAKSDKAHKGLAEQIKQHSFTREYEAVVIGNIRDDVGKIDAPIGRHPIDRKKMTVTDKNSKNAVTHYTVINRFNGFTHLRLRLETGRTHQIRVHMSYLGHPVAGDTVYGPSKDKYSLGGQCLHARKIGFIHPITGEYLELMSDLPQYFIDFLKKIS